MKKLLTIDTRFIAERVQRALLYVVFGIIALFIVVGAAAPASAQSTQDGSVGLTGTISAPPPSTPATITVPSNGQSFTSLPVPVRGTCPNGTLVKVFKNNVFAGSVQCNNGSFEINIDLFTGQNEIIVRVYDDLDQAGPDSSPVTVTFIDDRAGAGPRVSVTSNFAKRGANPGNKLDWPIIISGGSGPYAVSVDWGDGTEADLQSVAFPGNFDLSHVYKEAGVYNIVIKVSDNNGGVAFLQVVGIANGPLSQVGANGQPLNESEETKTFFSTDSNAKLVWWPATITVPFVAVTYWLGKKSMVASMKKRIARGEHPFADL